MEQKKIFLSSPHMSEEGYELEYIREAFEQNWIAPLGENVNHFEEEMCVYTDSKKAVALSSGTAAIHLALKLLNVKERDLVFCQSLTFSATANPILYEKALPVFIDSDEETWNLSPIALEKAFERYDKLGVRPKAVMIVHLYGLAANLDEIIRICKKYDTPLIEDAAESLGTLYKGRMTGSFGDYGVVSFNGNKIITSSGGGMLLCNTADAEEKAKKAVFWSTQARDKARHYQHSELGYNYRMSNIVAGIGRGQLKVLDDRISQKRNIFQFYQNSFLEIEDITMMPCHDEYQKSNCWLSCILLKDTSKVKPLDIQIALEGQNIEARPIWKPMHLQPIFQSYDYVDNGGVSQSLFEQGVCLPSDTKMTDAELDRICSVVTGLWR